LFFTKAPTPGLTKTRLTSAKGGFLTEEEATELYTAVMLDVAEIGHAALDQLNAAAGRRETRTTLLSARRRPLNMERIRLIFEESFSWPIRYITDQGKTFNEPLRRRLQATMETGLPFGCFHRGRPAVHARFAHCAGFSMAFLFRLRLRDGRPRLLPVQACGVSLVGLTEKTPMDFDGVFYNPDGTPALDAITALSEARGIPAAGLAPSLT